MKAAKWKVTRKDFIKKTEFSKQLFFRTKVLALTGKLPFFFSFFVPEGKKKPKPSKTSKPLEKHHGKCRSNEPEPAEATYLQGVKALL